MLKPGGTYGEGDEALEYYAKHTAQIEVSSVHYGSVILSLSCEDNERYQLLFIL